MAARKVSFVCLLAVVVISTSGQAMAQYAVPGAPRPASNTGGTAGSELNTIYMQDVGQGYSSQSLNRLNLSSLRVRADYYSPDLNRRTAPRIGLGVGSSTASKPFSSFTPEPTVSPYLNLFREDFDDDTDFNYQTLVRPQLQQQQINQQVQRQAMEMSRRMQSFAAQADFNPEGSKSQFPTGHQTVFMYYGHYYPTANNRPRR